MNFWKGGQTRAPACSVSDKGSGLRLKLLLAWLKPAHLVWSVSDKGPHDRLKPLSVMVFQPDPVDFNSWHKPSQAFTKNMCHTHGWPQQEVLSFFIFFFSNGKNNFNDDIFYFQHVQIDHTHPMCGKMFLPLAMPWERNWRALKLPV